MAVAPEALEAAESSGEAAGFRAASRASGQLRRVPAAAVQGGRAAYRSVSSPSQAAQTITKLIWAVALGLIALQIAAEATGQKWSFALPTGGRPLSKQPYQPLYAAGLPVPMTATGGTPGQPNNAGPPASGVVPNPIVGPTA